jgi:peptide/nickel transport system permease protein
MGRYIARRLIGVVLILGIISAITFGLFFLIPANPALKACGKGCNPDRLHAIEQKLGLDKPVFFATDSQYVTFIKGVFVGRDFPGGGSDEHCGAPCLGYSFATDQPVFDDLKDRFPVTFSIAIGAATLWLVFGVAIGILSALRRGSFFDRSAMTVALGGVSLPPYFTGLVALTLVCFSSSTRFMDTPAYVNFADNPALWAKNLILPWLTLAFLYAALYARLTRANMLETMGEDYIRTARAKGLSERRVIGKHGLRAALTPIVTIFGLDLGGLLGGAILTESVYGFQGLGKYAIDAINADDFPKILGVTLFAAFFIVVANLIVDILYAFVDPKVSYA